MTVVQRKKAEKVPAGKVPALQVTGAAGGTSRQEGAGPLQVRAQPRPSGAKWVIKNVSAIDWARL